MNANTKELILAAARRTAQARGYGGLNFRDLAADVGIKAASIHYYFPSKADLGAAVARRYREDSETALEALSVEMHDPVASLRLYPDMFRQALENENRMCLVGFMSAEYDALPDAVKKEVQAFTDVNVAWIGRQLSAASLATAEESVARARAIFSAIAGAQLMARSRSDIAFYDGVIDSYRKSGLLPSKSAAAPS
ncbi:TetR/AcrR family transcriptional regulator [Sphingobium sp. AN641]|uniref:TetR/AcrR family transcriptional regulator n=1 Tax=Sphingobium sp. AN641 TaxID=3133443 RepID=UPI0030BB3DED